MPDGTTSLSGPTAALGRPPRAGPDPSTTCSEAGSAHSSATARHRGRCYPPTSTTPWRQSPTTEGCGNWPLTSLDASRTSCADTRRQPNHHDPGANGGPIASRHPPRRSTRPGAVCGGRGGLRRGQSVPLFARSTADERERPRTGAAPAGPGVDAQAPARAPRSTQPGGGRGSGRGGRRCRALGAPRARTPPGDDLRHGAGRAGWATRGLVTRVCIRSMPRSTCRGSVTRSRCGGGWRRRPPRGPSTKRCWICLAAPGRRCRSVRRNSWWFARLRTSTRSTRRAVRRRASRHPRGRWSC